MKRNPIIFKTKTFKKTINKHITTPINANTSFIRYSHNDHFKIKKSILTNKKIYTYWDHLKDYTFPKPNNYISIPNNPEEKSLLACKYRINHKLALELWLYYDKLDENKNIIYKKLKSHTGVYIWINNKNKKYYIGSSINLQERITHYFHSFTNKKEERNIYRAVKKHGLNNFSLGILWMESSQTISQNKTKEELNKYITEIEQSYINYYKPKYNQIKANIS